MGNLLSAFASLINTKKEHRLLMVGLDASGKTTILYKLKLNETVHTIPTIGFNVETVDFANINFTIWDVGGQDRIRSLWRHYFMNVSGLIFVMDSADRERFDEAKEELHQLLSETELNNAVLLVLANKQDLPNSMSPQEITAGLDLFNVKSREWYVQSTIATTGDGIYEGLHWLSKQLNTRK